MEKINEKAITMLQDSEVVVLTSITPKGYPRPVPMSKIKADGLSTIWLATGYDSLKTKDYLSNPKAGICFYEAGNNATLWIDGEFIHQEILK